MINCAWGDHRLTQNSYPQVQIQYNSHIVFSSFPFCPQPFMQSDVLSDVFKAQGGISIGSPFIQTWIWVLDLTCDFGHM